jgi:hypothetical protein
VKVLAADSEFLRPSVAGMTPATNAHFNVLYPRARTDRIRALAVDRELEQCEFARSIKL